MTPAPVGTNFAGITLSHSWGAVLVDKTVPVEDLDGFTTTLIPSYSRFLGLFGLTARVDAVLPVATGEWSAFVGDSDVESKVTRTGLADPIVGMVLFVAGAPAMTPEQFKDYRRKTIFGFSLRVALPLGQYDENKLVNLGSNRWRVAPGLNLSHWTEHWTIEAYAGSWLFTENPSFFGGNVLEQAPLYALQMHVGYNLKPGMWLSAGVRQTTGGETTMNGIDMDNPIKANRVGLVFGAPLGRHHTLKLLATTGTTATKGNDFNTLAASWIVNW